MTIIGLILGALCFFFLLAVIALILTPLYRSFILFPNLSRKHGWKYALRKCAFSLFLLIPYTLFETANLTGFSWSRFGYVPETELIESAIKYRFPQYSTLNEFKVDYSSFTPRVRYWGSWSMFVENNLFEKLLGFKRYQVLLPNGIVILDADGKALSNAGEDCNSDEACPIIPADHSEKGIVGIVDKRLFNYRNLDNFSVEWLGNEKGKISKDGNCFSAEITSIYNPSLVIDVPHKIFSQIYTGYGFYLVTIESNLIRKIKISPEEFELAKSCDDKAMKVWREKGVIWEKMAEEKIHEEVKKEEIKKTKINSLFSERKQKQYYDSLAEKIEKYVHINFPTAAKINAEHTVKIYLPLQQNGSIFVNDGGLKIIQTSGNEKLDQAALQIVKGVLPAGRLPVSSISPETTEVWEANLKIIFDKDRSVRASVEE